ncbi:MAG: hypothetical protein IT184_17590 [Acidobacteria bacterium]|nr:hypothetical protein [Acidobacteriota bacterium]
MSESGYPAARVVAARVQRHFVEHRQPILAAGRGAGLAPEPDLGSIEAIIDVAFWASLRREEGRTPRISLALLPPAAAHDPLTFESWLPLTAASLAKLAPAVERPGIHLGLWRDERGELGVWGTTRGLPPLCFVLEVVTSGLLVIKHRSESFGKFVNVAALEGDSVKVVDQAGAHVPGCPSLVASLLGVEIARVPAGSVNVLVELAASMRAHGRGGALLVVPSGDQAWADSIVRPVLYAVSPPYAELALLVEDTARSRDGHEWQEDFRRAIDALAGLTAVDGATIISDRYELLAFGAKIARRRGSPTVERVLVTEPVEGGAKTVLTPSQLGGTRHFSAAQFVFDQPDATALVASQDGRFTIFQWSSADEVVHAHRVETLLL